MLKKIIFNMVLVVLVVIVLDFCFGKTLRHFFNKQIAGTAFQTTYAIDSTKADILIFGSSRANHHYIPSVFENSLNMTFYNAGRDGTFINYSIIVSSLIIKRYSPKIIIFDITPGIFCSDENLYNRLTSLRPYYENHSEIRAALNNSDPFEKFKTFSCIYPFNSGLIDIIIGNLKTLDRSVLINKGYIPIYGSITDTVIENVFDSDTTIYKNTLNAMKSVVETCKKRNIRVVIVSSPLYQRYIQNQTDLIFANFAKINQIEYFNLINDSIFLKHPFYFKDQNHLNNEGAVIFSQLIVDKIKQN